MEDQGTHGTIVTIYGLMGHAGHLRVPLETLDVEELERGEEFVYNGKIYQIRSVIERGHDVIINVMLAMNQAMF